MFTRLIFFIFFFGILLVGVLWLRSNHLEVSKDLFLEYKLRLVPRLILKYFGDTNNYEVHFILGRIHFVEGKLDKSLNDYTEAIRLNPNHKVSYYGRGLVYGFMGEKFLINAQSDFEKYIQIEEEEFKKTGRRAYGAWAGYNDLAWIYFLKGEHEKQEELSRLGLQIDISNPWLLNNLGVALLSQDKCQSAKEYFQRAKIGLEAISVEDFGEAYSGDDQSFWKQGYAEMLSTIGENIKNCEN